MKNYSRIVLVLSGFIIGLVGVFNYSVDPYLVFDSKRIDGFNSNKVIINPHVRMAKTYQPTAGEWDAVIVGNSRVDMGLSPWHRCFEKLEIETYNAGVPGVSLRRQFEYAFNVAFESPVKLMIVGLDYVDFIVSEKQKQRSAPLDFSQISGGFRYTLSGEENPDYWRNRIYDYYRALLSFDALSDSLETVALQSVKHGNRDDRGFNPATDLLKATQKEGVNQIFTQKLSYLDAKYSQPWGIFYKGGAPSLHFSAFEHAMASANARGIRVIVLINPLHQKFWELMRRHGQLGDYDVWREKVVAIVKQNAGTEASVWDFGTVPVYTEEELPARGADRKPLEWFWEPAHYRSELGDLMLDTVLGEACESTARLGQQLL